MAIYAIADLHLSYSVNKPMDVFGSGWDRYMEKMEKNWHSTVSPEDTVLIPGDISWAMNIEEASGDLRLLDSLPGKKIILKGNHDYWWDTITKIKKFFYVNNIKTIDLLQNNSFDIENISIFGTRGWILKNSSEFTLHDLKIYNRELQRLKLSIASGKGKAGKKIVMLHYPPVSPSNRENDFTRMIECNEIDLCVFGHIHSTDLFEEYNVTAGKTQYRLVSSDYLDFKPYRISNWT
jgi:predicted phosphohydrolase